MSKSSRSDASMLVAYASTAGLIAWCSAGFLSFMPWVGVSLPEYEVIKRSRIPRELVELLERGWSPGSAPFSGAVSLAIAGAGGYGLLRTRTRGGATGAGVSLALSIAASVTSFFILGVAATAARVAPWLMPDKWERHSPAIGLEWPLVATCAALLCAACASLLCVMAKPALRDDGQVTAIDRAVDRLRPPKQHRSGPPASLGEIDDALGGGGATPD